MNDVTAGGFHQLKLTKHLQTPVAKAGACQKVSRATGDSGI